MMRERVGRAKLELQGQGMNRRQSDGVCCDTYEIFSSSQKLGLYFRLRSRYCLGSRLRWRWQRHCIQTRNPRVIAITAVDADADRATRNSGLETLAVLLQTHALSALAASLMRNIISLVTTLLKLGVKRVGISFQDGPNGMRANLSMLLCVATRNTLACRKTKRTTSKALAVSIKRGIRRIIAKRKRMRNMLAAAQGRTTTFLLFQHLRPQTDDTYSFKHRLFLQLQLSGTSIVTSVSIMSPAASSRSFIPRSRSANLVVVGVP